MTTREDPTRSLRSYLPFEVAAFRKLVSEYSDVALADIVHNPRTRDGRHWRGIPMLCLHEEWGRRCRESNEATLTRLRADQK